MRTLILAAVLATAALPATAIAQIAPAAASPDAARFERDRQSILAQAGQFRVRFDMRENVSFRDGYEPLDEHQSGGNEIVRVVYDTGDRISLQHILVMEHDGQSMVIKHWRQDWVWQPETVLTYSGPDAWTLTPVSESERAGAWSQTVWQTDDSPRYGGVGRWSYENGMAAWTSTPTWRPLARRDAVRHPVYDRYLGSNRHALTPFGWVHIQDNMKMATAEGGEGEPVAVVQEDVINTYRRWDGYDAGPGDAYWAATRDYWAAVRTLWDEAVAADGGVHVEEVAETGAVTGTPLMDLAEKVQSGEITTEAAIAQARTIIGDATTPKTGA
ncbi:MAG TPA: DUF6607 family protein [Brevundimonas sp.]